MRILMMFLMTLSTFATAQAAPTRAGQPFNFNCTGVSSSGHTANLHIHGQIGVGTAANGVALISSTVTFAAATPSGLVKGENLDAPGQVFEYRGEKMNVVGARIQDRKYDGAIIALGTRGNSLTLQNQRTGEQIAYILKCTK